MPDQEKRWAIVKGQDHRLEPYAEIQGPDTNWVAVMPVADHKAVLQRLMDAEYPSLYSLEQAILKELNE